MRGNKPMEWTLTLKKSDKVIICEPYRKNNEHILCEVEKITPSGLINISVPRNYYDKATFYPNGSCRTPCEYRFYQLIPCTEENMLEYEKYEAKRIKEESEQKEISKARDIITNLYYERNSKLTLEKARIINKYLSEVSE